MLIYIKIRRNISLRNNFLCNFTPFQLNSSSHSVLSCPLWLWYLIPFPPSSLSPLPPPPVSTVFVLSCVFPRRPLYGDVLVSSLHAGGEAFFSCLTGYQLQGPRVLTCRNASTPYWSGKEPHCLGEYWLQFTRPFWLLFSKNCIIIIWQIFWNYYYIIVVIIVVIIHIIRTEVVYTENNMN